ncbi:hypothetical protein [Deinococcus aquaticus]|uniref:hypothetical protein n=1 Tax=Deinococcus aquaticus TaxID=328692 RepID=UPI00360A8AD9
MTDRAFIEVRGAREHNLKNVSLDIPKRQLTVFTGVSGSGKSSLVFDTLAAEAQRQLNETFTAFVQGFLPHYGQPDVDSVSHLNAPVVINQKRVGAGRARQWARTRTSPRHCGCCSPARGNRQRVRRSHTRSTRRRACARSARASGAPRSLTWTACWTGACL